MRQKINITPEKLVEMLLNLERSGGLKNTIVAYKSDTPAKMNKKSRVKTCEHCGKIFDDGTHSLIPDAVEIKGEKFAAYFCANGKIVTGEHKKTPWETVRKITVAGGRLGVNYQKAVENKAERITGEKVTFQPEKMKGKSHFNGSKVIAFKDSDPSVKYLILDVRNANRPKSAYFADGKHVEKSTLLDYMGKPPAPSFVEWRTITIDNVKEISLNGKKYIVK